MQSTINDFAQKLNNHPILRQAFILAVALASITLVGYHFGTFDQAVHIPFLKAMADPTLYTDDPFLALRQDQYSFFWYFFLPFQKAGVLEPAMFLVHVLGIFLFFTAVWDLSMTLFGESLAALFALLAFIIPHTGFVGFPVIEFSLQSRSFVLPFLIYAIINYLKNRKGFAFLILGLMYNLNLLMTNFVLILLIISSLVEVPEMGWKKIAKNLGIFMFCALPVLIWKIRSGNGLDFSIRPEWFSAISSAAMHQIFFLFSNSIFLVLTFGGISAIVLFFIARKNDRSPWHDQTMLQFMIILIGILIVQVITSTWLPLTFIIQLQISRASIFILIFAYIYFANYLAQRWINEKGIDGNVILQTGSLVLSPSPVIPLLAWAMNRIKPDLFRLKKYVADICLMLMLCAFLIFFLSIKLWEPGIHVYERKTAWVDVQNWARKNTPKESVFITPPQEVSLYQPDWRVFSERGTVVSIYEVLEIALKPDYYETWKPRFESLAPKAQNNFRGIYIENLKIVRMAFNELKSDQILAIAKKYNANYLVIEKEIRHDFPFVYENDQYKVYELS